MREAKFDRIVLMKLTVELTSAQAEMTATGAFVNTRTGQTHGSTKGSTWSEETVQALVRLRESIEADMERVHFADDRLSSPSPLKPGPTTGLGEYLKKDDKTDEVAQG